MNYSDDDIARQLRLGEDSHWEFKSVAFAGNRLQSPRRDSLADEIAAFANTDGGVLLCGVTDDGTVQQGITRPQLDELESVAAGICADSIKPSIDAVILRRELETGRPFLLVAVPPGYAQHDSPGGSFKRVGSSARKMTGDERVRLAQRRGQGRFPSFDKQPMDGTGFATLDQELWLPLLSAEGAKDPKPALAKMALLESDKTSAPRATVAGILLCTPNPEQWLPNARISAVRYRDVDRASGQADAQEITGPLNRQIAQAAAFAARNMSVAARKDPARVDLPQYSVKALFEAIVNAVAHRDYAIRGSAIRLSIFADRLEIQSPGALPNTLTVASMTVRQAARNEALVSALARMPVTGVPGSRDRHYFMERRGDGVPIIVRQTRELCGREPEYRQIDEAELLLIVPAAEQDPSPASATIAVRAAGQPVADADLLLLYPSNTWTRTTTDGAGLARANLHTANAPMTVFAGAPGYTAGLKRDWTPARRSFTVIELEHLSGGGSAIFPEDTGQVPGLTGELKPKRDERDRISLYAPNIVIDNGRQQPVYFVPGRDMCLADAHGTEVWIRIVEIVGRSALVEYRSNPADP